MIPDRRKERNEKLFLRKKISSWQKTNRPEKKNFHPEENKSSSKKENILAPEYCARENNYL